MLGLIQLLHEQLQLVIILIEGSDLAPSSPQIGSNDGADYVHKYIVRDVISIKWG